MNWLAQLCILAFGWRRVVIMLIAGAVAALSMPPLFFLPALFLAMPMWIWCLDGVERGTGWRRLFGPAFHVGFFFGLGYFVTSLHWIGSAFFVDGGWLLVVMPFAVLALSAALAIFWGLASAFAHLLWSNSPSRILVLTSFLAAAEFLRGHILTGFPFDLFGYALTANETMMQLSSVIGIYGLTFLAPLLAFTPALVWPADERALSVRLVPFFAALAVLAIQLGFGQYRLNSIKVTMRNDMRMRLVQPNIDQAIKWQANSADFVVDRLISLSKAQTSPNNAGLTGVTHLIWPEAALPFFLSDNPQTLTRIADLLPPGTTLISGVPRRDGFPQANAPAYNSILAIDDIGETVASYDKTHLVPFGEYLPFEDLFSKFGLRQFVSGSDGWTAGDERRLQTPPQTPAYLPLICYEAIFSGDLGEQIKDAQFLLNLTNDGWFDGSIGPSQLFHHARLRSVEEGIPMVRVANTGISAIVDPLGRLTASLVSGEPGTLDVNLPNRLESTWYSKLRNWPFLIALFISAVIIGFDRRRTKLRKNI